MFRVIRRTEKNGKFVTYESENRHQGYQENKGAKDKLAASAGENGGG